MKLREHHQTGGHIMLSPKPQGTGLLVQLATVCPGEYLAAVLAAKQTGTTASGAQGVTADAAIPKQKR